MNQGFNPLKSKQLFAHPERLSKESAWNEHVPFAMLLVELHRPRVIVELGTHCGVSYFAFCQAVMETGAGASCYAVDTWAGDGHTGPYGGEVFEKLKEHYKQIKILSQLLSLNFDGGLTQVSGEAVGCLFIYRQHASETAHIQR